MLARRLNCFFFWLPALVGGLATLLLTVRLVDLQIIEHNLWSNEVRRRAVRQTVISAFRGRILDSMGRVLACDVPVKSICVDPWLIPNSYAAIASKVAEMFSIHPHDALRKIFPREVELPSGKRVQDRYEVLAHDVSPERWELFKSWLSELEPEIPKRQMSWRQRLEWTRMKTMAFWTVDATRRFYPNGPLAGRVIGYTRPETVSLMGIDARVQVGVNGIEKSWDSFLRSTPGVKVGPVVAVPSRSGLDLVLTIDAAIQGIAESELAALAERFNPKRACAVVINPKTGDILAMAMWPPFDPNHPGEYSELELNMVIGAAFDPGSTMKAVTFAALLERGLIDLDEPVDCHGGYWRFANLRDHHPYETLRAVDVLAKSSNIGTAVLAYERLDAAELQRLIYQFGFGSPTGVGLPGEIGSPSMVPQLTKKRYVDFTRVVIGHGISATPLQVAMAMSTIANQGVRMRPRLVQEIRNQDGGLVWRFEPRPVGRVISPQTAKLLVEALEKVTEPGGTAPNVQLKLYTVAGKTGTAQKRDERGFYRSGLYYSSFVGFFPASDPQICILVGVDEPDPRRGNYGSTVAGPCFRQIAERVGAYLHIKPDKNPDYYLSTPDDSLLVGQPLDGPFFGDQLLGLP